MRRPIGRVIFALTSTLLLLGEKELVAQQPPTYAEQGWSETDRNFWYSTSQGSRLLPWSWMQALERAEDGRKFLSDENIGRYRYLTYTTPTGPRLPVGFVLDAQDDRRLRFTRLRWLPDQGPREPWIGFSCSACHTTEVARGDRRLRIDGAPGLADYQSFVTGLQAALLATRADPQKWDRFAREVLGAGAADPANLLRLGQAVDQLIDFQRELARMNAIPYPYGFSRVDAFGHIFNRASLFAGAARPTGNPSSAPVSYPFLWNVPQHDKVQWNGSVRNFPVPLGRNSIDIGAIGRNAGEVIGVFGDVVTLPPRSRLGLPRGFASSINFDNLIGLERMLGRLMPPAWPADMLGPIREGRAQRGAALFQTRCASCHANLPRTDLTTPIIADMSYLRPGAPPRHDGTPNVQPGTDPVMACNAYSYAADSGRLAGYRTSLTRTVPRQARVVEMTGVTVINSMIGNLAGIAVGALKTLGGFYGHPLVAAAASPVESAAANAAGAPAYPGLPDVYRRCIETRWSGDGDAILGYKARPLGGIWATAPYLHNGSVASLYELLLPPERRLRSFFLGTRQFDPEKVGFVTDQSADNWFEYNVFDPQGRVIWGNYNGGHDYDNAGLSDDDRYALVEYMKTL